MPDSSAADFALIRAFSSNEIPSSTGSGNCNSFEEIILTSKKLSNSLNSDILPSL